MKKIIFAMVLSALAGCETNPSLKAASDHVRFFTAAAVDKINSDDLEYPDSKAAALRRAGYDASIKVVKVDGAPALKSFTVRSLSYAAIEAVRDVIEHSSRGGNLVIAAPASDHARLKSEFVRVKLKHSITFTLADSVSSKSKAGIVWLPYLPVGGEK